MTNSFVISGLIAKRAELSGAIAAAEKAVDQMRANLESLDITIRLFDPSVAPKTIKPKQKRPSKAQLFRAGELTRTVLSILRQSEKPMTVREVASAVGTQCSLDMSTIAAANVVVANVRAALARPHDGLRCEKRGREPMVYWISA